MRKNALHAIYKAIDSRPNTQKEKNTLKNKAQKENFLRHYLSKYSSPRLPPSWMMIQMLTWGDLSHLYAGLHPIKSKKQIAKNLGLHAEVLESWLKGFNDLRNLCAHHGRLWNKVHGRSIKIPSSSQIKWLKKSIILNNQNILYEKRTYMVLVAIQTLLYTINPTSSWGKKLKKLLDTYPKIPKSSMGMPDLWYTDPFWDDALHT